MVRQGCAADQSAALQSASGGERREAAALRKSASGWKRIEEIRREESREERKEAEAAVEERKRNDGTCPSGVLLLSASVRLVERVVDEVISEDIAVPNDVVVDRYAFLVESVVDEVIAKDVAISNDVVVDLSLNELDGVGVSLVAPRLSDQPVRSQSSRVGHAHALVEEHVAVLEGEVPVADHD